MRYTNEAMVCGKEEDVLDKFSILVFNKILTAVSSCYNSRNSDGVYGKDIVGICNDIYDLLEFDAPTIYKLITKFSYNNVEIDTAILNSMMDVPIPAINALSILFENDPEDLSPPIVVSGYDILAAFGGMEHFKILFCGMSIRNFVDIAFDSIKPANFEETSIHRIIEVSEMIADARTRYNYLWLIPHSNNLAKFINAIVSIGHSDRGILDLLFEVSSANGMDSAPAEAYTTAIFSEYIDVIGRLTDQNGISDAVDEDAEVVSWVANAYLKIPEVRNFVLKNADKIPLAFINMIIDNDDINAYDANESLIRILNKVETVDKYSVNWHKYLPDLIRVLSEVPDFCPIESSGEIFEQLDIALVESIRTRKPYYIIANIIEAFFLLKNIKGITVDDKIEREVCLKISEYIDNRPEEGNTIKCIVCSSYKEFIEMLIAEGHIDDDIDDFWYEDLLDVIEENSVAYLLVHSKFNEIIKIESSCTGHSI